MEITLLRFQDLLGEGASDDVHLTQGQMLLLGLNGLFEKMETGLLSLANVLKQQHWAAANVAANSSFEPLKQAWRLMVMLILFILLRVI